MSTQPKPTFLQSLRDLRESLRQLWRAILHCMWSDSVRVVRLEDGAFNCYEIEQADNGESLGRQFRVVTSGRSANHADVLWQLPQVGSMHHKLNAVVRSVRIVQRLPYVWDCFVTYSPCDCDQPHY